MKSHGTSEIQLESAVCAGCGCLCDDVALRFRDGKTVAVERACSLGEKWLRALHPIEPRAFVGGKPASEAEAVEAAAKCLRESKAPAILGLNELTVEALREAAALAAATGAALVPCPCAPETQARSGQLAPECTATLGEVRNTADLVIFWRSDPDRTHPRHLERVSLDPPLLDGGARALVVADSEPGSQTARRATEVIQLSKPDGTLRADLDIVRGLRLLLEKGVKPDPGHAAEQAISSLETRLAGSRHAHVFLGPVACGSPALWNAFHLLAARSRMKHRITVSALPARGNGRGVLEVIAWSTGGTAPPVDPERFIELGAADFFLALGLDFESLGARTRSRLRHARRVSIGTADDLGAAVSFRIPGLDPRLAATVARSDGVLLSLDGRQNPPAIPIDPAAVLISRLRDAATSGRPR